MTQESDGIRVLIRRLPGCDLPLPAKSTSSAAGFDLKACVSESLRLQPGRRVLIPTGFSIALPEGWEAQIRPRSGLAVKSGITMLNSPGTIDSDYRGEVKVLAINHGDKDFVISHGDRIAQLLVAPVPKVIFEETDQLPDTQRGEGGFGHTGSR
jgi:dUTP pyrophosphatase